MAWHDHPDASRIVREHWQEAQCFIVAEREPCIGIAGDEVGNIGDNRRIIAGPADALAAWQPPASWFIAVIVCPGDDTLTLTNHVRRRGFDPARVHFYLHAEGTAESLKAWRDAGLPLDRVDDRAPNGRPFTDWTSLHKALGLHFNLQILRDFM